MKRCGMLVCFLLFAVTSVGCNGGQEDPVEPEQQIYEDMENTRDHFNDPNWDNREPFMGDENINEVERKELPYNDADVDTAEDPSLNLTD